MGRYFEYTGIEFGYMGRAGCTHVSFVLKIHAESREKSICNWGYGGRVWMENSEMVYNGAKSSLFMHWNTHESRAVLNILTYLNSYGLNSSVSLLVPRWTPWWLAIFGIWSFFWLLLSIRRCKCGGSQCRHLSHGQDLHEKTVKRVSKAVANKKNM